MLSLYYDETIIEHGVFCSIENGSAGSGYFLCDKSEMLSVRSNLYE